ncbi:LysR substrate-binding domain-containing protein [Mesorhizobium sp. M0006]|uniref:LysR substrate-binding domain-containing protein n=1 Tax=Mesorhizobium sp. M0006 TaxID=2956838 RepID=UPI00333B381C
METRFLSTFLSVVKTGSIAETARRLNITPSAVTQRMRALEDEIGQPLVRRSGQAMQPTSAANAIIRDAERILALENDLKAAASADRETGLLRIGVIQTALTGLLPDILLRLRQNRPGIELYLVPGTSGDLYALVNEGGLDAAFVVKPHFVLPKSLDWARLRKERLLLITASGQEVRDPQSILRREPFLRYDRNHWGGRIVDQYLRRQRIRPNEQYELDSLEAIVIMVSRGLGVAIVPDWAPPWPQGVSVGRVPLPDAPVREIGVIWRRTSVRLPLIRAFVSEVVP